MWSRNLGGSRVAGFDQVDILYVDVCLLDEDSGLWGDNVDNASLVVSRETQ